MFLGTKIILFIYIFSRIKLAILTTKKSKNTDNSLDRGGKKEIEKIIRIH